MHYSWFSRRLLQRSLGLSGLWNPDAQCRQALAANKGMGRAGSGFTLEVRLRLSHSRAKVWRSQRERGKVSWRPTTTSPLLFLSFRGVAPTWHHQISDLQLSNHGIPIKPGGFLNIHRSFVCCGCYKVELVWKLVIIVFTLIQKRWEFVLVWNMICDYFQKWPDWINLALGGILCRTWRIFAWSIVTLFSYSNCDIVKCKDSIL